MRFAKEIYEGKGSDEVIEGLKKHLKDLSERVNPEGWGSLRDRRIRKDKTSFVLLHAVLPGQRKFDPGPKVNSAPKARRLLPLHTYEKRAQGWDYNNAEMGFPGTYADRIGNWFLVHGTVSNLNYLDRSPPYKKIYEFKNRGSSETIKSLENHEEGWDAADIDDRGKKIMAACEAKYPASFEKP
jgi:hypothetical protein